jgi:type IV secretory pathway VirB2 component (pilin)
MVTTSDRIVTVLGGTGFSVAVLFDISVCTAFLFGLHPGNRAAVMHYLVLMIHSFDRLRSTFT